MNFFTYPHNRSPGNKVTHKPKYIINVTKKSQNTMLRFMVCQFK